MRTITESTKRVELGLTQWPRTDKMYVIDLVKLEGTNWGVVVQYGKRHRVGNLKFKARDVGKDEAEHMFDKLVGQKIKKGYTVESER